MKAKAVVDFALQFGVKLVFNDDLIVQQSGHYFLLNNVIKPLVKEDFYYAGAFLGKVKGGKFFPSFILLSLLAKEEGNRVVVDRMAGWLFICGRDVFGKGVLRTYGSIKRNSNILVLNEFGECLGFGKILSGLAEQGGKNEVAIQNVSDVGDFLRRERGY
jgi:ribosome biogenesis protein Nip4